MKKTFLQRLTNWSIVFVLIVISIWLFGIYNDLFQQHVKMFAFIWFFIPILALWLRSEVIQSMFSLTGFSILRIVLMSVGVVMSLSYFVYTFNYRDMLYASSHPEIVIWLEDIHFSGFEWLFQLSIIFLCIVLPSCTWIFSTRAIEFYKKHHNAT